VPLPARSGTTIASARSSHGRMSGTSAERRTRSSTASATTLAGGTRPTI
jgi:hypothetical protein